jgi:hypothetical protein
MHQTKGFIALITAIVLSLVLLTITVVVNQSGFFVRQSELTSEFKEQSLNLAKGCVNSALLKLHIDQNYVGNESVQIGTESCAIRPLLRDIPATDTLTIETQAIVHQATTNLRVVVTTPDFTVQSKYELAAF